MLLFRTFGLIGLLLLGACGFQPVYGDRGLHTATTVAHNRISIANIPDRDGQYLRNQLIDHLYQRGAPANALYTLKIAPLSKEITDIGIRKDASSTRGQMDIRTQLTLVDNATGAVVLKRQLHSVGGYNQLDNQFATLVSREALTENVLREISDNIVTELNLFFHRQASAVPSW